MRTSLPDLCQEQQFLPAPAPEALVISAMGANKDPKVFYNRVKAEMQAALQKLGYPCLRIMRTSLLLRPRKEIRFGEKAAILLTPLLKPLFFGSLKKYRPVEAEKVALEEPVAKMHIYESNVIE